MNGNVCVYYCTTTGHHDVALVPTCHAGGRHRRRSSPSTADCRRRRRDCHRLCRRSPSADGRRRCRRSLTTTTAAASVAGAVAGPAGRDLACAVARCRRSLRETSSSPMKRNHECATNENEIRTCSSRRDETKTLKHWRRFEFTDVQRVLSDLRPAQKHLWFACHKKLSVTKTKTPIPEFVYVFIT
jgi:hypothetical protein